jgi:DNA polymerase-3 subunit delta
MAGRGSTYDDLRNELSRKQFSPVYLLYGEEDFLAEEATEAIVNAALAGGDRGFNLDVLYGSDADVRVIISHALSFPMMADRRVVVVRGLDKLVGKELLSNYIEQPSPSTSLILVSTKPDFRKKPYTTAKTGAFLVECKPLYENQVPAWINRRITKLSKAVDPEACTLLAAYVGNSLREVQNEIDKLDVYIGDKKKITADDVRAVVGASKEFNVFELQRALGAKDLRHSTEIMERMLEAGEAATMITVMLTRYFSTVWKLQDLRRRGVSAQDQARIVAISPYFFKEYLSVLNVFSIMEIEHAFELIAEADERLKTTSDDPKNVMHALVVQLLNQRELAFS